MKLCTKKIERHHIHFAVLSDALLKTITMTGMCAVLHVLKKVPN